LNHGGDRLGRGPGAAPAPPFELGRQVAERHVDTVTKRRQRLRPMPRRPSRCASSSP